MRKNRHPFYFWLLLVGCNRWLATALKDCIDPVRASLTDADNALTCSEEYAIVPKSICHNKASIDTIDTCKNISDPTTSLNSQGSAVCAFVAESLFAEWCMLDAAFWTSGTCQASIKEGRLSADDALRVLPKNHELVGIRLQGRDLVRALEQGLLSYFVHGDSDAFPHTAGLKYDWDLQQPKGQRLRNVKLLGFGCDWKPLNKNATYMILTNAAIAASNAIFATSALSTSKTGRGEAESLFHYATSVCILNDNWHQMRVRIDLDKIPLPATSTTCKSSGEVPDASSTTATTTITTATKDTAPNQRRTISGPI